MRRLNWLSTIAVALFAYAVIPAAIQNLTVARVSAVTSQQLAVTPLASLVGTSLTAVALGVAVVGALGSIRKARWGWWIVLAIFPFVAQCIAALYGLGTVGLPQLAYLAIIIIAAGTRDVAATARTLGTLVSWLAGVSLVTGILLPAQALFGQSGTADKAIFGSLLAGPLHHPNTLGQMLALGLPFVFALRRRRWQWVGLISVLVALVWSASRTGLLAAATALIVMALWKSARRPAGVIKAFSPLLNLVVHAAALIVGPVLVAVAEPRSFTDRGQIWAASLDRWSMSPWNGAGPGLFNYEAGYSNNFGLGAFHAHSLSVHLLVTAGILGASTLAAYMYFVLCRSWVIGRAGLISLAAFGPAFLVGGWLELPADFFSLGSSSWITYVPLALVAASSHSRRGARDASLPGTSSSPERGTSQARERATPSTAKSPNSAQPHPVLHRIHPRSRRLQTTPTASIVRSPSE